MNGRKRSRNGSKRMNKHFCGRQGALAPWHKTILAKQNDLKKKAIVEL